MLPYSLALAVPARARPSHPWEAEWDGSPRSGALCGSQLISCAGGHCAKRPAAVRCVNAGSDGVDAQWDCTAELDSTLAEFCQLDVQCAALPGDAALRAALCPAAPSEALRRHPAPSEALAAETATHRGKCFLPETKWVCVGVNPSDERRHAQWGMVGDIRITTTNHQPPTTNNQP